MTSDTSEYFLLGVSNKVNLDLCLKYSLAGLPGTLPGAWGFSDISVGDYVSLLYGAKVFNLYQVERKYAVDNSENAGPWPPITLRMWNKTYYFPFRFEMKPIRGFQESLIRMEFEYVGENLLLRGGYRKTHFQADHVTLLNVSNLGELWTSKTEIYRLPNTHYVPHFTMINGAANAPRSFRLNEIIVQSAIRHYLRLPDRLEAFVNDLNLQLNHDELEVLGEKALTEGNVDVLIKEKRSLARSNKIVIEVKNGSAKMKDVDQTRRYVETLGKECVGGVLFAKHFPKNVISKAAEQNVTLLKFNIDVGQESVFDFERLVRGFSYVEI